MPLASLQVPIKERLMWQGSPAPHKPVVHCLCCHPQASTKNELADLMTSAGYKFHDWNEKTGKCKNCGMQRGLAAMSVSCGSKKKPK